MLDLITCPVRIIFVKRHFPRQEQVAQQTILSHVHKHEVVHLPCPRDCLYTRTGATEIAKHNRHATLLDDHGLLIIPLNNQTMQETGEDLRRDPKLTNGESRILALSSRTEVLCVLDTRETV